MKLTTKQKKEYLEGGAQECPHCHSVNISADSMQADGSQAWCDVSCSDCGESWQDIYKLVGVEGIGK